MWLRVPKAETPITSLCHPPFLVCSRGGGGGPGLRSSLAALGSIFYPFLCCVTCVGGKRDKGHCSECKVLTDMIFFPSQMRKRTRGRQKEPEQNKDRSHQMAQNWYLTVFLSLGSVDILNCNNTA